MQILQPAAGIAEDVNYVASTPNHVVWGRLPSRDDRFVGSVGSGADIVVDTVSHEGLLPDQGSDPASYFASHGVPESQVLDDAVAIVRDVERNANADGPHVVTGPIQVRNAHPGDLLAVTVRRLDKRVPYGVVSTRHGRGVLAENEDYDGDYGQFCRVEGDVTSFPLDSPGAGRVTFPLHPFLGIIGVTPDSPSRPNSIPPADYGGNIDLKELSEGSTLFLPVQVEGAGLYVGDPHFAQGNGEVSLTALEASLRATLHVDVVPQGERERLFPDIRRPFAYAQGRLIPLGIDEDLDQALRDCVLDAVRIVSGLFGMAKRQAYLLLSAAADFEVTQAVDLTKGVHALIDTAMFKECEHYGEAMRFLNRFADDALPAALAAYESALMGDDVRALSSAFAEDAQGIPVVRSDAGGMLVGHDAIASFRTRRGGAPKRTLRRRIIRTLGRDAACVTSEFHRSSGGTVVQTQVWQRLAGRWKIVGAHLTYPQKAVDGRIWRVAGSPLIAGKADGDLRGLTVAVKDLFALRGFAVGAGNPQYLVDAPVEPRNAVAVQRLLDAGADVQGIAQTDEFAYSLAGANVHYGTPPNPNAPGRISGGSSSGPASAVACGQADIGLGTDTAGSIRIPAAYQGLWGIRTTHGRIPRDGVHPLSQSFDTVGLLARDARTLAHAARVLMPQDDDRPLDGRLAVCPRLDECAQHDVRAAFNAVRQRIVSERRQVDELPIGVDHLEEWLAIFQTVRGYEAWKADGRWVSGHADDLAPEIAARFEHDSHISPDDYADACTRLDAARDWIRRSLDGRVLLIATASSVAPEANPDAEGLAAIEEARAQTLLLTGIAGIGGLPAVSIPCETAEGLPCGTCLIGPAGTDNGLIELAARLANA